MLHACRSLLLDCIILNSHVIVSHPQFYYFIGFLSWLWMASNYAHVSWMTTIIPTLLNLFYSLQATLCLSSSLCLKIRISQRLNILCLKRMKLVFFFSLLCWRDIEKLNALHCLNSSIHPRKRQIFLADLLSVGWLPWWDWVIKSLWWWMIYGKVWLISFLLCNGKRFFFLSQKSAILGTLNQTTNLLL